MRAAVSVCVCHMACTYCTACAWISCLRMHAFLLIRQIGVDAMRGDERKSVAALAADPRLI